MLCQIEGEYMRCQKECECNETETKTTTTVTVLFIISALVAVITLYCSYCA